MNLNKHTLTEKKFINAINELNKLYKQERALPYRKLDEPYQHGWNLTIVLRDDFKNSKQGPVIQSILDKFAVKGYTRHAKHVTQIRKKPDVLSVRRLLGDKSNLFGYHSVYIRDITKAEYEALPVTEQKYFHYSSLLKNKWYDRSREYFFDLPHHYLLVKVDKRMITHVQDIDPILKKQIAFLDDLLKPYWRSRGNGYGPGYFRFENRKERRASKVEAHNITVDSERYFKDYDL